MSSEIPNPVPSSPLDAARVHSWKWSLLVLVLAALVHVFCWLSPEVFHGLGGIVLSRHHLDMDGLLAASDAAHEGINVYGENPLDELQRPHVYGRWWLGLAFVGIRRSDTDWLAWVLTGVFGVAVLWQLAPRSFGESLAGACLLGSFPLVLAVERANNDMCIYLLVLGCCLLWERRERVGEICALLVLVLAVALKYYPIALVALLVDAKGLRTVRLRLAVCAVLLVVLSPMLWQDMVRAGPLLQIPYGILGLGSESWAQVLRVQGLWADLVRYGACLAAFVYHWLRSPRPSGQPSTLGMREHCFIAGSLILCACFWLTINHSYRWLFGLLLIPHLWSLAWRGEAASALERSRARLTLGLLLGLPWLTSLCCLFLSSPLSPRGEGLAEFFAVSDRLALLVQVPTWVLFLSLVGYVTRFLKPRLHWLLRRELPAG